MIYRRQAQFLLFSSWLETDKKYLTRTQTNDWYLQSEVKGYYLDSDSLIGSLSHSHGRWVSLTDLFSKERSRTESHPSSQGNLINPLSFL